jgi:hypothetical protein
MGAFFCAGKSSLPSVLKGLAFCLFSFQVGSTLPHSAPPFGSPTRVLLLPGRDAMRAGLTSSLQRDDLVHLLRYLTSLGVDSVRNGPKLPLPKTEIK